MEVTRRTVGDIRPVVVNGERTGAFRSDLIALNQVMVAIAYAEYFRATGQRYDGEWEVFSPDLASPITIETGEPDGFEAARAYATRFPFTPVATSDTTIYKCGVYNDEFARAIYRFEFYEGFVVYVWSKPDRGALV